MIHVVIEWWLSRSGALVLVLLLSCAAFGSELSVDGYLQQVTAQNEGYRAGVEASEGALLRSREGDALLLPNFFANAQRSDNRSLTSAPAFMGTRTLQDTFSVGVKHQFGFGLGATLSYNLNYSAVEGTQAGIVTNPNYYTAAPKLELVFPLWRNFAATEMEAIRDATEAGARATSFGDLQSLMSMKKDAEATYWRLVIARQSVEFQRDVIGRLERMRNINEKRVGLNLADRSDLLQAEAGLEAKRVELQIAIDEERGAARRFNTLRGTDSDRVDETLTGVPREFVETAMPPARAEMRADVRQAQEAQKAAAANAVRGMHGNSPTLDLFSTLSMNGLDPSISQAVGYSFSTTYPWMIVGVRLSTSLDFGLLSNARQGYSREQHAAELRTQRKLFEQKRDWEELVQKLEDAKRRLKLTKTLEEIQRDKLMHEQKRHERGRTTVFQVLSFENEYAAARLSNLRTQNDILNILAEMKTYAEKP